MIDKGAFILSLDCEGMWGIADHVESGIGVINQKSLKEVYDYIDSVLSFYSIKASYAFTTLFTQDENVVLNYTDSIREQISSKDNWYNYIYKNLKNKSLEGWLGRDFYLKAKASGHEIAWHGFTHHLLSESTPKEIIEYELVNALDIARKENDVLKSLIYPRNQFGHADIISSFGFACYRKGLIEQPKRYSNKYYRVADEFNILKKAESFNKTSSLNLMSALPSGYFLNWPAGARKIVPTSITVARWKNIIKDAANKNKQAHMWFHPHNMITAPRMRDSFEQIIKYVSCKVKAGEIVNLTMGQCIE